MTYIDCAVDQMFAIVGDELTTNLINASFEYTKGGVCFW